MTRPPIADFDTPARALGKVEIVYRRYDRAAGLIDQSPEAFHRTARRLMKTRALWRTPLDGVAVGERR